MQQEKIIKIPEQYIETRQRLKDAALQQISEVGYHQTTVNSIAEAAGVSISTLYAYYRDKKMLVLELLEECQQIFYARAFDNKGSFADPLESIKSDIRNTLDASKGYETLFRESYILQCTDRDVESVLRKYENHEIQGIQQKLEQEWPAIKNPQQTAVMVHSVIAAMVNRYTLLGLPISADELVDELAGMIYSYLKDQA